MGAPSTRFEFFWGGFPPGGGGGGTTQANDIYQTHIGRLTGHIKTLVAIVECVCVCVCVCCIFVRHYDEEDAL